MMVSTCQRPFTCLNVMSMTSINTHSLIFLSAESSSIKTKESLTRDGCMGHTFPLKNGALVVTHITFIKPQVTRLSVVILAQNMIFS